MEKIKEENTDHHGAYSGVHRQSSEYNDGDYDQCVLENFSEEFIGKVAFGNTLEEEIVEVSGLLTQDELLDEAIMESFPASDPPGYISKSKVDKELHP
jgi:hypothetical protein